MDYPEVFGLEKSKKSLSSLEKRIMESVRSRNRHSISTVTNAFQESIRDNKMSRKDFDRNTGTPSVILSGMRYRTRFKVHWTQTWTEYCEKCSLHGLKYVGDFNLHPLERLFWGIAFILAVITSAYFITNLYQKWENNPVIVSIGAKSTQLIDIPFPAVTVCTMSKAKKSSAEEVINSVKEEDQPYKLMLKDLCDDSIESAHTPSFENEEMQQIGNFGNWDTIQSFMTQVRQPCHEMLLACNYGGEPRTCMDIFNPSLTDEGICCSFNKVKRDFIFRNPRDLTDLNVTFPKNVVDWTPEGGYPEATPTGTLPLRPRGAGSHLGLTLVLDANIDDYYCSSTASVGFKVRLHNPVETPKVAEFGYFVTPGEEYRVAIKPMMTNASSAIRGIPENKRQCLFANERYLKYYRTYTQRNCVLECEANYTLQICKCVPYYLPKDASTKICGKKQEKCTKGARKIIEMRLVDDNANTTDLNENATDNINANPNCQCLPGCSELGYDAILSSSHLTGSFPLNIEYLTNFQKNQTYFRRNMAVVHFFFTESQFINYRKTELFGFTEFLSNTGGLLGLFLGFSFLSAVEAAYFLSLRLWCSLAHKSQQSVDQKEPLFLPANQINPAVPYPFAQ